MDEVTTVQRLLEGKSSVSTYLASFVSTDGQTMVFDIGGSRLPARSWTAYRPMVNETVWLVAVDGSFYFVGPAVSKPGKGTVVSADEVSAVVTTDIGDVTATTGGLALAADQVVKLYWQDGPHVLAILSSPPVPVQPPDAGGSGAKQHVDTFTAVDAGTYSRGNWKQPQVWASDTTLGAWFYGSKIRDTLRTAQVQKVEIFTTLAQAFGAAPAFATHPHAGKPGGGPVLSNSTPLRVSTGTWLELPVSFGQYLAANVGGVGLNHGGFNKFRSLTEDPQSGALRITSIY